MTGRGSQWDRVDPNQKPVFMRGITVDELRAELAGVPGHHRVLADNRPVLAVLGTTVQGQDGMSAVNIVSTVGED